MRKFIFAIAMTFLIFTAAGVTYANADKINVNITVTDITDVNNPFNVLVPRQSLEVEYKDLGATYGSTFYDLEMGAEGITYLHALVALHEEIYGVGGVTKAIALTPEGKTLLFMGKDVGSIMYKNGDDIFDLPQNVSLQDGDEINVCLYNAGEQQMIATFDKSTLLVPIGEEISLSVSEHFDSPVDNNPVSGAEITDENGILLTDAEGDFITSDETGNFTVRYDEVGEYIVSIMPEVDYYMTGDVQTVVSGEWVTVEKEVTTLKEVTTTVTDTVPSGLIYCTDDYGGGITGSKYEVFVDTPWDDGTVEEEMEITYTKTELVEVTEIVEVEEYREVITYVPDEPKQKITYTPPFCVIEVTDELIVDEVYFGIKEELYDNIFISLTNTEYDPCTVWAAGYDEDGRLLEVQSAEADESVSFVFGKGSSYYKVFFWDGLTPKTKGYISE